MGYRLKNIDKSLPVYKLGVPKSKLNQKQIFKKLNDEISI